MWEQMDIKRLSVNFNIGIKSFMESAVLFSMSHSIYEPSVSKDMTTSQAMMLALFYSLLEGDYGKFQTLLQISKSLPQLHSSFIGYWLRDDFKFRQKDVARVLSTVARFIQDRGPIVPDPVLLALSKLEEKYDVFNFFKQMGDDVGQELLAFINPMISRSTQVEPEDLQNVEEKCNAVPAEVDENRGETDQRQNESTKRREETGLEGTTQIVCHDHPSEVELLPDEHSRQEDELDLAVPYRSRCHRSRSLRKSLWIYSTMPVRRRLKRRSKAFQQPCPDPVPGSSSESQKPDEKTPASSSFRLGKSLTVAVKKLTLGRSHVASSEDQHPRRLHDAVKSGLHSTVINLLKAGEDVNGRDEDEWTPLHHAAHNGHFRCARTLLHAGADPLLLTKFENTPLSLAKKEGHRCIVELLSAWIQKSQKSVKRNETHASK